MKEITFIASVIWEMSWNFLKGNTVWRAENDKAVSRALLFSSLISELWGRLLIYAKLFYWARKAKLHEERTLPEVPVLMVQNQSIKTPFNFKFQPFGIAENFFILVQWSEARGINRVRNKTHQMNFQKVNVPPRKKGKICHHTHTQKMAKLQQSKLYFATNSRLWSVAATTVPTVVE